ncbi:MAG: diaminobutyrate--2-oxoglutarate transaminase [Hyphomicrobiales bacterium]|nr:diaminobutyrate--2-oxoglutarate transaminase [Hyphomicrobiales bacterium]
MTTNILSKSISIQTIGTSIFAECESNVQSYARSMPAIFTVSKGAEVWDEHGRRYLDFLAGAGSLNYGHNNPVMKHALIEYIASDGVTHSLDLHTEAKARFLAALNEIILKPRGLDYVAQFTGPTGTNAVEAALKLARKVTGRKTIVHFTNSFHGVSLGSLSVTSNKTLRGAAGVSLENTVCVPFDGYYGADVDTIDMLERQIDDPSGGMDLPAAVIIETVQGEGGLNAANWYWLRRLEAFCKRRKILLIVDDIQAGCGRTGPFFSFEAAQIKPDIVTLSKSLSGYGLPFSIVLAKRECDQWEPGEHNGTFRGNNHAFVTATAMLLEYWTTSEFSEEVQRKSAFLAARLSAMADRFEGPVVDVKGRGLMRGLKFASAARAKSIAARAYQYGLIIERCGPHDEVVKCMPPLTITFDELAEGLDLFEQAIADEFSGRAGVKDEELVESAA